MKITIDTKEDNHEDIRKVISLLSNLIGSGRGEVFSNQNGAAPTDTTNLMNMFGDAPANPTASAANNDSAPNFGSFLNLVEQKNGGSGTAKKEEPKIEFY